MAKLSVAGVVRDFLESHPGDQPLAVLLAECIKAKLAVTEAQVYAGVQSMASTGKCGRGQTARTYCRNGDQSPDRPARVVKHTLKTNVTYNTADILEQVEAAIGPPVSRHPTDKAFGVVLLGDHDAEYILERAEIVLKHKPVQWAVWNIGPNKTIGFYPEAANETEHSS